MRTPDRTAAWSARVLAIALAAVVALMLVLTVLDLLIPGPPFVLLGQDADRLSGGGAQLVIITKPMH